MINNIYFLARYLSEPIIEEDRIEKILAELDTLNSRINIREQWHTLSNKSDVENNQYTKLYEPSSPLYFLSAREDSEAIEKVTAWMSHWRTVADKRKNVNIKNLS